MLNNSSSGKEPLTISQMNRSGTTGLGGLMAQRDNLMVGGGPELHPPVISFCDMKAEMKEFAFEKAQTAFS